MFYVFRALTKHLEQKTKDNEITLSQPLEALWRCEERHARGHLILCARVAPNLLGSYSITSAKTSGEFFVSPSSHFFLQKNDSF